jgi:ribosomal protein S12 methylthiotransferase accessory factor
MLELDSRAGRAFESQMFDMSSNGLASGNCIEEALVHALCELVERHAMYLIDREPEKRLPVDHDSIDPPYCQDLIRKLRAAGMKLAIYDLTWEVDLPCLMVRLAAPDFPHVWIGFGCHPAKDIALSRAITEAAQSRLTYISGARDDLVVFSGVPDPSQAFEAFAEPPAVRTFADLPDRSTLAVGLDLVMIIDRLQAVGCQPFYVDLLRPGIDIPVVIAFVPGLREVHNG